MTKCKYEKCETQAIFGNNKGMGLYCFKHKSPDMFDVINKKCKCGKKQPTYGLKEDMKAVCCFECKEPNMIDVIHKKCKCKKHVRACFGYIKDMKPICCIECKESDMIDVVSDMCIICKKIRPTFGLESNMKPTRCFTCKDENMINVILKKCQCGISIANFGYESNKKRICCSICKSDDMIDLVHSKCLCGLVQPSFGLKSDMKSICCVNCKSNEMIYVKNICVCGLVQPTYGYKKDMKRICCVSCKTDDMIDVTHELCKNDLCETRANQKYKGYCAYCFSHLFPLDPLTFQIKCKTKEIAVRDFINANYDGFQHDKPLEYGGCDCTNRRRIDHRKLVNNTMIAIETDENQHKNYNKKDEENRYNDLISVFTCKWYFIRFNPDSYKDKTGNNKNPQIATRLKKLQEEINKSIKIIEEDKNEMITIVKLFYDE